MADDEYGTYFNPPQRVTLERNDTAAIFDALLAALRGMDRNTVDWHLARLAMVRLQLAVARSIDEEES